MAAVASVQAERRGQKSVESVGKTVANLEEVLRRNGISHLCGCSEKISRTNGVKAEKSPAIVKLNGGAVNNKRRQTRGRGAEKRNSSSPQRITQLSPQKKRRSARIEKQECFSHVHNGKQPPSPESQDRSNNNHSLRHNGTSPAVCASRTEEEDGMCNHGNRSQRLSPPSRRSPVTRAQGGGITRSQSHGHLSLSKLTNHHGNQTTTTTTTNNSVFHAETADNVTSSQSDKGRHHRAVPNGCRVSVARLSDSAITKATNNVSTDNARHKSPVSMPTGEGESLAAENNGRIVSVTKAIDNGSKAGSFGNISQLFCQGNSGRSTPTATVTLATVARFQAGRANSVQSSDSEQKTEDLLVTCRWRECGETVDTCALTSHLRTYHVEPQHVRHAAADPDVTATYVCEWEGCKVIDKPSLSSSWLDRHILGHSGEKPFCCIVDGCGLRFSSQFLLERHVNAHFNQDSKSRRDDTPNKHLKKKKPKTRRIIPVKRDDFVDTRTMEGLKLQLQDLNYKTQVDLNGSGKNMTFHSTVIARRSSKTGDTQTLLTWTPPNILPDEWVNESQVEQSRSRLIPLSLIPHHQVSALDKSLFNPLRHRKHRRK